VAKQKKTSRQPSPQTVDELKDVRIIKYEVTTEPIEDRQFKRLPNHVKDTVQGLRDKAQSHPLRAIPELNALIKKYPKLPLLYNYLSVAYSRIGQIGKAEKVVRENYRRNPDYLFARLNYAEICLRKGDYDQVAEIFDQKYDLKLLYPKRKKFHISEVANFMGLIGLFFFKTGKQELAEKYYDILKEIASDYPMTKILRRKLHPGFLRRLLNRMVNQS